MGQQNTFGTGGSLHDRCCNTRVTSRHVLTLPSVAWRDLCSPFELVASRGGCRRCSSGGSSSSSSSSSGSSGCSSRSGTEAFEGGGSARHTLGGEYQCMHGRRVSMESARVFCRRVCLGSERNGPGVPGMSQPCMIQLDHMLCEKFSLMLMLFM